MVRFQLRPDRSIISKANLPLHPFLEKKDVVVVIHVLVTSRLNYCNELYMGMPLKTLQKL